MEMIVTTYGKENKIGPVVETKAKTEFGRKKALKGALKKVKKLHPNQREYSAEFYSEIQSF